VAHAWQSTLERWQKAGLLDPATVAQIQAFEASNEKTGHLRWPVLIAVGFGALMLGAGVLLFVAAHWDELSPGGRFSLVLALVAVFHVCRRICSQPVSRAGDGFARHRNNRCGWPESSSRPRFSICRSTGRAESCYGAIAAWVGWWFARRARNCFTTVPPGLVRGFK
jgi:hypothetical protein